MNSITKLNASIPRPPASQSRLFRWALPILLTVLAGCQPEVDVGNRDAVAGKPSEATAAERYDRHHTLEMAAQPADGEARENAGQRASPSGSTSFGGRKDALPATAGPDEGEARQWLTGFLEKRFAPETCHAGAFYMRSDAMAYRFRGEGPPRFEVAVTEVSLAADEQEFVRASFRLRVTAAGWATSSKPATFEVEDFPALLPWSPETAVPTGEYLLEYPVDAAKTYFWSRPLMENMLLCRDQKPGGPRLWGDEQGRWLASLRPLQKAELIKLLNLDQTPLLNDQAKLQYRAMQNAFPRMVLSLDDAYLVLHEDLLDSANDYMLNTSLEAHLSVENGGSAGDLLRDLAYDGIYPINASYRVTELRGGAHQLWLVEEPLREIDRINRVSFRGKAYLAVRGMVRGRYLVVRKAYLDRGRPRLDVGGSWSDWIEPETRIGRFRVVVTDGQNLWLNDAERRPVHVGEPTKRSLEEWCVPEDVVETIRATIGKQYVQNALFSPLR